MSHCALYALLAAESLQHLKEVTGGSPIQMLDIPALFLGDSAEPITPNEDAVYLAVPRRFVLMRNPFTGNTSLVLTCEPQNGLLHRLDELPHEKVDEGYPFLVMSDMVHAIPRHYRAFLNSVEEGFMREGYLYEFTHEFVVEHNV